MTRARLNLLLPALALACVGMLVLPTAASARTQPTGISHKHLKAKKRISRREGKRLDEQRWKIRRLKKRARRDGYISYVEAKKIRKAKQKLQRMERFAFHNDDRRHGRRGDRRDYDSGYDGDDSGHNHGHAPGYTNSNVAYRNVDGCYHASGGARRTGARRLGNHVGRDGRDRVYESDTYPSGRYDRDDRYDRDNDRNGKRKGKRDKNKKQKGKRGHDHDI